MTQWHRATLLERHTVAQGLFTLSLSVPAAVASLNVRPGQYHRVLVTGAEAHFAIASAPGSSVFEYLLRTGTEPANTLEQLPLGSAVEVTDPDGPGYPFDSLGTSPLALIAVGSAIAPMRAVLHALEGQKTPRKVSLLWGVRHEAELVFAEDRAAWEKRGVRIVPVLSRGSNEWSGLKGRVQNHLAEVVTPESTIFICGHADMEREVTEHLLSMGVPAARIFLNHAP